MKSKIDIIYIYINIQHINNNNVSKIFNNKFIK